MSLRESLLVCMCILLASCGREESPAIDARLYSTDVSVSIAQHTLVLPFLALEDHAYRQQSFSLDHQGDTQRTADATNAMLRDSAAPDRPWVVDSLSVVVRPYGWNESSSARPDKVCAHLSRAWARSVCDNPWAAIAQALPANRFRLVDLGRLQIGSPHEPARCVDDGKQRPSVPQRAGIAAMVCRAPVFGADEDEFHLAVVRIDGNLGALWTVWRHGQNGESAEAMTHREGQAIIAFVRHGLGASEAFPILHDTLCRLRRPDSKDSPKGPDCPGN